jgi:GT2 family glycosyltransferase
MNKEGISVVILTYKGRGQLKNCLLSVIQSFDPSRDEIIITEDGEDLETQTIIKEVTKLNSIPIKHITQSDIDKRFATARNRGFLAAEKDTILFLDHDILLPRNFLKQLQRYHRPNWVTAGRRFFLDEKSTQHILKNKSLPQSAYSLKTKLKAILSRWEGSRYLLPLRNRTPDGKPQSWRAAATFCVAISRSDFERVDGFDSRYDGIFGTEDWDLFARLANTGIKFGYLPRNATVAHMHHRKSAHNLKSRNYEFLDQVVAERRTKAIAGLTTLVE